MEKEDNPSKSEDISTWFDQKYRIDRRSKVIPFHKQSTKITQQESPVVDQEVVSPEQFIDDEIDMDDHQSSKSIEPSLVDSGNTYLQELLEKILFDPKELNLLKKSINDLNNKIITANQLKKLILKSFIRIFEELVEFIPFYFTQELNKKSIKKVSHELGLIDSNLAEEIQEKDKLLEELGERINKIYLSLKEKVQGFSEN